MVGSGVSPVRTQNRTSPAFLAAVTCTIEPRPVRPITHLFGRAITDPQAPLTPAVPRQRSATSGRCADSERCFFNDHGPAGHLPRCTLRLHFASGMRPSEGALLAIVPSSAYIETLDGGPIGDQLIRLAFPIRHISNTLCPGAVYTGRLPRVTGSIRAYCIRQNLTKNPPIRSALWHRRLSFT